MDVMVCMGSQSDAERVAPCLTVLASLGISYAVTVTSAHRTPERTQKIVSDAERQGCKVFICAAGMAAHLAGAVCARTIKPVIGIPLSQAALGGMDALFSTVQMPSGYPVATVALDSAGARNAAWLAASILALEDEALGERIRSAREDGRQSVVKAACEIEARFAQ
ncbi:MAG: 5-(carboxyamino)imidazole ribonucleotide mutase [Desulfovibrionaceae bacterium]|nr:5-(carboxyamino)imidazole ribonucleotide mutase [Desulfovibrionaceae bacterium]